MFGKPQWFRPKKFGWGLMPITKEGWLYTGAWVGVMILPFLAFFTFERYVEGAIWLAASMGALVWDVKLILGAIRRGEDNPDMLHITDDNADDNADNSAISTRNFEMHVKD